MGKFKKLYFGFSIIIHIIRFLTVFNPACAILRSSGRFFSHSRVVASTCILCFYHYLLHSLIFNVLITMFDLFKNVFNTFVNHVWNYLKPLVRCIIAFADVIECTRAKIFSIIMMFITLVTKFNTSTMMFIALTKVLFRAFADVT